MIPITLQMDWLQSFADEFRSLEMRKISGGIDAAIKKYGIDSVYPKKELIFRAFELTPLTTIKAVMIGLEVVSDEQSGLLLNSSTGSMSTRMNKVFDVYNKDYPQNFNTDLMSGNIEHWATQGILLLNLSLTAKNGAILKHLTHWEFFYQRVLDVLKASENPIAWIPFGKTPTKILGDVPSHQKIFKFEKGVFLKFNQFLKSNNVTEIEW